MAEHYLDDSVTQPFWDNSVTPRLTIDPGDVVVIECAEPVGQLRAESTHGDLANIDFSLVHALTGSIYINDAALGDALEVEILDMRHKGWGWTGHIPAFGLLQEDFDFAFIHHWELDGDTCHFGLAGIRLPFEPFPGCVGVAPAEAGRLNTVPPRINGGNVDIRDLVVGSTFWLPVLAEGALFSTGDCHAAQGQGEVSGTGIESPMTVTMRFNVRKDLAIQELQIQRPSPMTKTDSAGYHITTAHGPDLMENAKNAVRYMIDWLIANHGLSESQAYCICSVAGDLKIAEIVDAPNWVVAFHMPLSIFG
ncbi:MAG: acetamidase/formamidase family protein [Chloroflexi bacterium]|nr:acetamidase/formamidase family protein [Chloroflexota bacterium]